MACCLIIEVATIFVLRVAIISVDDSSDLDEGVCIEQPYRVRPALHRAFRDSRTDLGLSILEVGMLSPKLSLVAVTVPRRLFNGTV